FRQLRWLMLSIVIVATMRLIHPKVYFDQAYRLYIALIVLLLLTYAMPAVSGGKRWLFLGPVRIQPSELGKIIMVMAIARYLTDYRKHLSKFQYAIVPLGMAALPALLIIGQPDLGTGIIYVAVVFVMMYWGGISHLHLFVILAPVVSIISGFNFYTFSLWMMTIILVLYFSRLKMEWKTVVFSGNAVFGTLAPVLWNSMQPYQQRRIMTMLDATSDPQGAGYQVIQSRVAIGAGGIFGSGLGQGTQTHLRFLPESNTDFIIAVVGEELGFLAILFVLILFGWLFLRLLDRATTTQYRFASLTIIGFGTVLIVHTFINMGMAIGLMPVTGLPLPYLSYGGSFLLTCILIIGLTHYLLAGEPR
ncbi:FtsW/RodA/SpoVE family cell cycle protein, partial [Candidatus Neomarinimicrobiota bacterium]